MNSLKKRKHGYLIHIWADKNVKGTVVNRALPSWYEGSLEITLTVPLQIKKCQSINQLNRFFILCFTLLYMRSEPLMLAIRVRFKKADVYVWKLLTCSIIICIHFAFKYFNQKCKFEICSSIEYLQVLVFLNEKPNVYIGALPHYHPPPPV